MNRDQKRAKIAFETVSQAVGGNASAAFKKKFSTRCRKMPSILHKSGLCQAIAFYEANCGAETVAQPNDEQRAFRQYLAGLAKAVLTDRPAGEQTRAQLATLSRTLPFGEYHWLSREAMQCAVWMKRYAEALIGKEEEEQR